MYKYSNRMTILLALKALSVCSHNITFSHEQIETIARQDGACSMGTYQKFNLDPMYLNEKRAGKTFLVNNQIIVDIDKQFLKFPDGQQRTFRKKTADVLLAFLEQPNTPITSHHFLEKVWNGRVVSENVLKGSVYELRKLLKDDQKSIIVTIPKYGYLFTAKVSCPVNIIKPKTEKKNHSKPATKYAIFMFIGLMLLSSIVVTMLQ